MNKILSFFLLSILLTQSLWAQSCPLTNTKLTDLRIAAATLAQNVSLSPACQKYEVTVNQANQNLKDLAEKMSLSDGTSGVEENRVTALQALTQLNKVSSVFNDKNCGKELIGFLDYLDAFADVANGMAPFMALYGGPEAMPWVMGTALGATAVKSIVSFFKSKSIDMRNPEQSTAFLRNSCSFYNLDLVKSSIDDIEINRFSRLEIEFQAAKQELAKITQNAPSEPNSDLHERVEEAYRNKDRLRFLQQSFQADPLEACIYIQAYASLQDGSGNHAVVTSVWENYEETLKETPFRLELEKNFFLNNLNASASQVALSNCKEVGQRWLSKMDSMSQSGIVHLEKRIAKQPTVKEYEQWKLDKEKATQAVAILESKINYLNEMRSGGFDIEYSQIINSHEQVKDALFQSYKYLLFFNFEGLAGAWLKTKQEDARSEAKKFAKRRDEFEKRVKKIKKIVSNSEILYKEDMTKFALSYVTENGKEHPEVHKGTHQDLCNQLRETWTSWYNGLIHARAGKNYCVTFNKVINQLEYPNVQRLCFGTSSKLGFEHSSLKNQVKFFEELKVEADRLVEEMSTLSCEDRGTVDDKLLNLPLV